MSLTFAARSVDNCAPVNSDVIRSSIDRLVIESKNPEGAWTPLDTLAAPFEGPQEHLITDVPTNATSIRAVGCQGGAATWVSHHPIQLKTGEKKSIELTLSTPGSMSCNGPVLESQVNGRFEWAQASFLAATIQLTETEYLIAGGASTLITDANFRAAQSNGATGGWVIFNSLENVFFTKVQTGPNA